MSTSHPSGSRGGSKDSTTTSSFRSLPPGSITVTKGSETIHMIPRLKMKGYSDQDQDQNKDTSASGGKNLTGSYYWCPQDLVLEHETKLNASIERALKERLFTVPSSAILSFDFECMNEPKSSLLVKIIVPIIVLSALVLIIRKLIKMLEQVKSWIEIIGKKISSSGTVSPTEDLATPMENTEQVQTGSGIEKTREEPDVRSTKMNSWF